MFFLKNECPLRGKVRLDKKTKNLIKRINPGEIALIDHENVDEIAGYDLAERKIKAVININSFISGKYPNTGPEILVNSGITLLDQVREDIWDEVKEGEEIEIKEDKVFKNGREIGRGEILGKKEIKEKLELSYENINRELDRFVQNTMEYACKEKDIITGKFPLPYLDISLKGKHVLVVVRGQNYREDLITILPYIREIRPVIIGVDGGADAVKDFGLKPHLIIGDMDSISDEALISGEEIIVHAYPDGRAPGLERIKKLGLKYKLLPAPGTSEDVALLLAYEMGAGLIIALGTHSSMIDFLDKGRKGMASTFLVRLKVGSRLVDARGVSQLYQGKLSPSLLAGLFLAAFIPIFLLILFSPTIQHIFHLLFLRVRLSLGGG